MDDRSKVRTGLAAVAALCAVATAPGPGGQAWAAPADGAAEARPYRTEGTLIHGTDDAEGAPLLKPGLGYVDSIAAGQKRYYSVRLDATSGAYVSAVAAPRPGAGVVSYQDRVKVTLASPDGTTCGSSDRKIEANGVAYPLADYVARQVASGSVASCRKAGRYVVTVERGAGSQDPAGWPLELRLMVEPPVKGGDTGQAPESSWRTTPPELPRGKARWRQGGTGFNDARPLSTGVWADQIRPGETHFYRVPVDWGQRLDATAELSAAKTGEAAGVNDALGLRVFNPARGLTKKSSFEAYEGQEAQAGADTVPVAYGNRSARADYSVRTMSFAGWYYLAVTVNPDVTRFFKGTVPLTLRVRISGTAKAGPTYDGDAVRAGFGLTDADRREAAQAPATGDDAVAAADDTDKGRLRLVGYVSYAVGALLLLGLGGWTLAARRRAPAAAAPASGPGRHRRYGPPPAW
ncbi:hypothetical protein SBI_05392 [Streptomyces bingchenggensis BCW-1]|uniref:Aromatic ring-opening dioxygenase LigA n=1 Tax=Streptomyces bingchenggensis (strain BCW-1) TaxID=749414 RepID=D7C8W1_STRBB|nr:MULTISPECIES: hypothetical protein [Streptomyces]ADI08512.1 hypothetical protein SBI_05392 [Streptomyces bingchenggensis BCW-1]